MNEYIQSATTNTATHLTYRTERPTMIETPAFIQIDCLNQTRITGRFARYSDPANADAYGAFHAVDEAGTSHYVLWAAILRVSVFPLDAAVPTVDAPKPIDPKS